MLTHMNGKQYLKATGMAESALADELDMPQSTLNQIFLGISQGRGGDLLKIIEYSKEHPAPDRGTITLKELVGDV